MAALTFLGLANSLIQKCGISGGDLASVTGQRGESARVVSWISEAYTAIQELHADWLWMQGDVSFTTISQQGSYTPAQAGITDFAAWMPDSFRIYLTAGGVAGERFMGCMDYPGFRDYYLFGSQRTHYGQPDVYSVAPDKALLLGMAPDAQGYTIVGRYARAPADLVLSADLPLLPTQFHLLIVYEAMRSYALYEAASEVMAEADRQYQRMLLRLTLDQLPTFGMAGPLV